MTRQLSIRMRLLTGLIMSLTIVFITGCLALYWSQRELLYNEFDRQLDQHVMAGMRELLPRPPMPTTREVETNAEVPTGLIFIAELEVDSGKVKKIIPAGMDISKWAIPVPIEPDSRKIQTILSPSGKEYRTFAIRMTPPVPPMDGPRMNPPTELVMSPPDNNVRPSRGFFEPGRHRDHFERVVVACADLEPLKASLHRWVLMLIAAGILGELLIISSVFLAVRRGLRPLKNLEAEIASLDDSNLQRHVSTEGLPGELKPMACQLNGLLNRLEDAFDRERAFTASAAHEFRTPLAGIRTQIEVCLLNRRSPEEYKLTLTQCLCSAESLQRMINTLLDLSRLDAGLTRPASQMTDIAKILRSEWTRYEPIATARGCWTKIELPDRLEFSTDPVMLENIISNIMKNAAEYADPNGMIFITAATADGSLVFSISNSASSLDLCDLPKLFDRFWRKDASRTNTGQHCGLGLAVANRSVEAMGGSIKPSLQNGILELSIKLPPLFSNSDGNKRPE